MSQNGKINRNGDYSFLHFKERMCVSNRVMILGELVFLLVFCQFQQS